MIHKSQPNNHEGTDVNRSYRPCNGPLSDEELEEIVRDHFERNKDNLDGEQK